MQFRTIGLLLLGAMALPAPVTAQTKSRSRKSAQGDKWSFCLKAAMMAANRRDDEQTSPPESLTGLQGEGGACPHPGRPDTGPIGRAFRRPPQSGHRLESPT